ncbi:CheR family methyltransferase [Larsenimonas salina]|uniref:CheR family methyltransferase n=1 Tax=Larsenimonas salina TaxID=1295565 RepID=UPI002073E117|nr:CheR family methyltransferase [Larsenimonas salina]MCM5703744.1 methyltransferase [Larsenimonas salina]
MLTDGDFDRIRKLIYERAGIALADHKREMVYSRLAKRLRGLGLQRFSDYLSHLESDEDSAEWEQFVNSLTTNLTSFFREMHHFPLLSEHALKKKSQGQFKVWCSAASTGEEPYSIAITLRDALGMNASASLVATDIDTSALAKARAGVYSDNQVSKISQEQLRKYFQKGKGARAGMVRAQDNLRSLIQFEQLNLLAPRWELDGPFDVIFCRNVMIYFDKPTQAKILERFATYLKPDGLLFAGHSENFSYITKAFRLRGHTVYELAQKGRG